MLYIPEAISEREAAITFRQITKVEFDHLSDEPLLLSFQYCERKQLCFT